MSPRPNGGRKGISIWTSFKAKTKERRLLKWSRLDCPGPFRKILTSRDHENECAQLDVRHRPTRNGSMSLSWDRISTCQNEPWLTPTLVRVSCLLSLRCKVATAYLNITRISGLSQRKSEGIGRVLEGSLVTGWDVWRWRSWLGSMLLKCHS